MNSTQIPFDDSVQARFWPKVNKTSTCWLWTAARDGKGYGLFKAGIWLRAHRYSYELLVGPIAEGMHLDHLCRVTSCVNPIHLEPVTPRENVLRVNGLSAQNARVTHCPRGHAYDAGNTHFERGSRKRYCRACRAAKITCPCGMTVTQRNLSRHQQNSLHRARVLAVLDGGESHVD